MDTQCVFSVSLRNFEGAVSILGWVVLLNMVEGSQSSGHSFMNVPSRGVKRRRTIRAKPNELIKSCHKMYK